MQRLRHITVNTLPIPVISLALDDTKAVLRLLDQANENTLSDSASEGDIEDLKTTQKLASQFFGDRKSVV